MTLSPGVTTRPARYILVARISSSESAEASGAERVMLWASEAPPTRTLTRSSMLTWALSRRVPSRRMTWRPGTPSGERSTRMVVRRLPGQVDQAAGLEPERVERRLVEAGDAAMDVERERLGDPQIHLARGLAALAADPVRSAAGDHAPHLLDTALRLVSHPTLVLLCAAQVYQEGPSGRDPSS